tara:strand:+ start:2813 stop:3199 length:387 start_codon:yes stop_codon:yes gene_type:complete
MSGLAVELPLVRNNQDGFALLQNYDDVATQNLKMLVLTAPGERIMDPDFGVGARHFLFENMTPVVFRDFKSRLLNQQQKYMPYIVIEKVDFLTTEVNREIEPNTLGIRIQFFNNVLNSRSVLAIPVSF